MEEVQKKVQVLRKNPQTWAFLASPDEEEEDSSSGTEVVSEGSEEEAEDMAEETKV